jgi:acetyl-CoA carboxylase carboxyl transferase subunit alpha
MYELADKFGLPVLTFIDTPGAYPGIGAEERGQSEAIGAALAAMARASVPIVATIIGEGGSGGGARARGREPRAGARVRLLLGHHARGVRGHSLEGWVEGRRGGDAAQDHGAGSAAAQHRRQDRRGADGRAHQDPDDAAARLDRALWSTLTSLDGLAPEELVDDRYRRFRGLGAFLA